jgi:glycine cleavage system H protein
MSKENPADRKYTKEHEWVKNNGAGTVIMGITDHAQELLTDIVFVELPPLGKKVKQAQPLAVVESVKSVSDIYSPVSGEVTEVNSVLEAQPELVNQDAFGEGWMVKLKMEDPRELDDLMAVTDYEGMIKEV